MNDTTAIVVLCTTPDEATAQELSSLLLAEKLAACITLLPGATSLYCWQGKVEQEYEVQMLIKSDTQHKEALLKCIQQNHPYELPELLVLPVLSGEMKYIQWLHASLA